MEQKTLDQYMKIQFTQVNQMQETVSPQQRRTLNQINSYSDLLNQQPILNQSGLRSPSQQNNVFDQKQPVISALAWSIYDVKNSSQLYGKQAHEIREMASLTKMMTLFVTLEICENLQIPFDNIVLVFKQAAFIAGTTAYLRVGDCLTLNDLFYGLMLNSGNDAALTIANYIGIILHHNSTIKGVKSTKQNLSLEEQSFQNENIKRFVLYMNKSAFQLGLKNTQFSNPHGLSDKSNRSNASDLGKLASTMMREFQIARQIVQTKSYNARIQQLKSQKWRNLLWTNTNVLLGKEGFSGLKTAWTPTAGPCLSAFYSRDNFEIIITILFSNSVEKRFVEAQKLAYWAENKFNFGNKVKQNQMARSMLKSRELQINSAKSQRIKQLFKKSLQVIKSYTI